MYLITFEFNNDLPSDEQLMRHRSYIDEQIQDGIILMAGPKDPRTGGVLIAMTTNNQQAEMITKNDPYFQEGLATYQITRFNPVKYRPEITKFIK